MGVVSRPVLEIVEGAVIVWNRIWMSVITEPPVETGVDLTKLGKGKGISAFEGAGSIRFYDVGGFFFVQRFPVFNDVSVSDKGGGIGSDSTVGHQISVRGFVDSNESSVVVFKGLSKVKVGSYQSLETGSCHKPVLSEYRYPFSSGRWCRRGAPQRDSSIRSRSWIVIRSCCSKSITSVLGGRTFGRSKSRVNGRLGSF